MIPIPARMAHLPVDRRGYPIPWAVYHDDAGRPHFQINDDVKRAIALARDWCPVCGKELWRGRWFVGGPLSAFHPDGIYIDPPMHSECAHYALMACPYIAAPNYTKRIDARTLSKNDTNTLLLVDQTMIPERPEVFVALMTTGQERVGDNVRPRRPYSRVEFWRYGVQLDPNDAALAMLPAQGET